MHDQGNKDNTMRKNRYAFGNKFHERDIIDSARKTLKQNSRPLKYEIPRWDQFSQPSEESCNYEIEH